MISWLWEEVGWAEEVGWSGKLRTEVLKTQLNACLNCRMGKYDRKVKPKPKEKKHGHKSSKSIHKHKY